MIRRTINVTALTLQATAAAWLLSACAAAPPASGTPASALSGRFTTPTARYALPDGAARLEFATGPYGRETWMVDLDAAGRVLQSLQVLNEAQFADVQQALARTPSVTRAQLLRWIGTPGEQRSGGRQGGEVWSWRYPTNDCLWFQVSVTDDGGVRGGAYAIDPRCDMGSHLGSHTGSDAKP